MGLHGKSLGRRHGISVVSGRLLYPPTALFASCPVDYEGYAFQHNPATTATVWIGHVY